MNNENFLKRLSLQIKKYEEETDQFITVSMTIREGVEEAEYIFDGEKFISV